MIEISSIIQARVQTTVTLFSVRYPLRNTKIFGNSLAPNQSRYTKDLLTPEPKLEQIPSLAPNYVRTFFSLLDNLLKSSTHSEINGFYFDQLQTEIQPWMRDQVVKWMLEVSYYVIV